MIIDEDEDEDEDEVDEDDKKRSKKSTPAPQNSPGIASKVSSSPFRPPVAPTGAVSRPSPLVKTGFLYGF